jgi:hypothetical protein
VTAPDEDLEPTSLLDAFTRIRTAAERHMDDRDSKDLGWVEETVTDIAIGEGMPFVKPVQFNRTQEGTVGADWLWWWLDSASGECFGALIQAKRIKRSGAKWIVDVRHGLDSVGEDPDSNTSQYRKLLDTAERLEVPAVYAFYTGGLVFRRDLDCPHPGTPEGCISCRRMAITMLSAFLVRSAWEPEAVAHVVFSDGVPLEDLADPVTPTGPVNDLNLPQIPPGALRNFLLEEQAGPRDVAKRIFAAVAHARRGQFSLAVAEPLALPAARVFREVPQDTGHFPGPYFEQVLRGLRTEAPAYLLDLLADEPPPEELTRLVSGVVLVSY